MQSMPILTNNLPPPSKPTPNMPMNDPSGSEGFSKILARDLASRKQQHDTEARNSASVAKAPDTEAKSSSLNAKSAGTKTEDSSSNAKSADTEADDTSSSAKTPDTEAKDSSSIAKGTDTKDKSTDTTVTLTQTQMDHVSPPQTPIQDASQLLLILQSPLNQDPLAHTMLVQSSNAQVGEMTAGLLQRAGQSISGKVINESTTAIQTGSLPRHTTLQSLQDSARPSIGAGRSSPETSKTANIAADEKILPQVATSDKTARSFAQVLNQESTISSSTSTSGPSSGVSLLSTINSATPNAPPTEQNLRLEPRVGTPAWDGALAQKVTWMSNQQMQVAQLQLNPPDLGPMEVTLTVGTGPDAETRIEFTSPHLAVREALQSALPQLREMMENSGISLGSATVSAESFQQQSQSGRQDNPSARSSDSLSQSNSEMATRSITTRSYDGMVDTFA
jgi:flagellar hook-length control protein FliK